MDIFHITLHNHQQPTRKWCKYNEDAKPGNSKKRRNKYIGMFMNRISTSFFLCLQLFVYF